MSAHHHHKVPPMSPGPKVGDRVRLRTWHQGGDHGLPITEGTITGRWFGHYVLDEMWRVRERDIDAVIEAAPVQDRTGGHRAMGDESETGMNDLERNTR